MKVLLVGLGAAGFSWYKKLKRQGGFNIAVVETNAGHRSKLEGDEVPFYTTIEEALDRELPDFVINATPPQVHTAVNNLAFDHRLPVLCEKPISFRYEESAAVVRRAEKEQIPFMVAENYRCFPFVRKLKQLIDAGTIGGLSTIDVRFHRYHHVQRNYTVSLLDDIAVHHFDMMRYLTGCDGKRVFAQLFNPIGSWSEEQAVIGLQALVEMANGIRISYTGSISARGPATEWAGDWRIEGTQGAIELIGKTLRLTKEGVTSVIDDFSDVPAAYPLSEFLASLREGRDGETSGKDYLRTQALVYFAAKSAQSERMEDVIL
ncbi:Gfo/Idh/MocA family protein [Paenibacillus hamazuiensis]|uniref:Gfo/Idh/MocA family protein n=1 Tax=Paenibacillus hamazuiensis TaxID=2936508 RepID=UPI00200F61DF